MITVKLSGGLGNQLFQYAFAYQLSKKVETGIVLDTSWFSTQKMRKPEILKFNIEYDKADNLWEENSLLKYVNKKAVNRTLRFLGIEQFHLVDYRYLKETRYHYKETIDSYAKDDTYVDGYWQCPKYFESKKEDLIRMYKPKDLSDGVKELGDHMLIENSIAIHVRKGDYPTSKRITSRLAALPVEYYQKAVELVFKTIENPVFYIFSNDHDYAIKTLGPLLKDRIANINIPTNGVDEWFLMKCCNHQIIGNSTFSWWPAYLNANTSKIVVAPNRYWGNDDIIPEQWSGTIIGIN